MRSGIQSGGVAAGQAEEPVGAGSGRRAEEPFDRGLSDALALRFGERCDVGCLAPTLAPGEVGLFRLPVPGVLIGAGEQCDTFGTRLGEVVECELRLLPVARRELDELAAPRRVGADGDERDVALGEHREHRVVREGLRHDVRVCCGGAQRRPGAGGIVDEHHAVAALHRRE